MRSPASSGFNCASRTVTSDESSAGGFGGPAGLPGGGGGGGFKGGMTYGETDELGHKAVQDVVNHHDYHATVMQLFGLDHAKVTFKRNGADVSLTDNQGGRVVKEILV